MNRKLMVRPAPAGREKIDESAKQSEGSKHVDLECSWNIAEVLAQRVECDLSIVENVVRLFEEDNTIPFIARYRKEETNFMEPTKLREIKENLDELREVQFKVEKTMEKIEKQGKLDETIKSSLQVCKTLEDIEHVYAPFKSVGKRTLADRAREVGLEPFACQILSSGAMAGLQNVIEPNKEGLASFKDVEEGVQHIIADIMAKDMHIIEATLNQITGVQLHSKLIEKGDKSRTAAGKIQGASKSKKHSSKPDSGKPVKSKSEHFQNYHNFTVNISTIKPHQILAINRGESLKVLRVSIVISDNVRSAFVRLCMERHRPHGAMPDVIKLINKSAQDAYERLVLPFLIRRFRSEMTKTAEKASVVVFASNLKKLLLTSPVRDKSILGIDPGFVNGCKFALVSAMGEVERTGVAYLHKRDGVHNNEVMKLKNVILEFRCETVAIGNGVACRETEQVLSNLIKNGAFRPLSVVFCIVSEAGASIYSASADAEKELPDLDVTVRGAVSIARRLQDPLAELVKIDPKNIGVGMYQHDINEKHLKIALDGVVEDAVGVVGADLNVASEALLRYSLIHDWFRNSIGKDMEASFSNVEDLPRHVSGISDKLAAKIVAFRNTHGPFTNRAQLMSIPRIGAKTFEQCAGFLRIMPRQKFIDVECDYAEGVDDSSSKKRKLASGKAPSGTKSKKQKLETSTNLLDATWIHPESYELAERLLEVAKTSKTFIGQPEFNFKLRTFLTPANYAKLAESLRSSETTLRQIAEGLMQSLDADVRDDYEQPLFRRCVTSLNDVRVGTSLTGSVTNVTHFGAFVDVGVGQDGLIHVSAVARHLLPHGRTSLELGDRVETRVLSVDLDRKRIGLQLLRLI